MERCWNLWIMGCKVTKNWFYWLLVMMGTLYSLHQS